MTKNKWKAVNVGSYRVGVIIEFAYDCGEPCDEYGRTYVCKYNGDSSLNMHAAYWLMGYGIGASEADAIKSFVADCYSREREEFDRMGND